jgi:hypothetical protein
MAANARSFPAGFVPRMTGQKSWCQAIFTFLNTKRILSSILAQHHRCGLTGIAAGAVAGA